jgi:hypothetical protein
MNLHHDREYVLPLLVLYVKQEAYLPLQKSNKESRVERLQKEKNKLRERTLK